MTNLTQSHSTQTDQSISAPIGQLSRLGHPNAPKGRTRLPQVATDTGSAGFHLGTGYDWIEAMNEHTTWVVLPLWGDAGYDLGNWPLQVLAACKVSEELYGIATYCEGDISVGAYLSRADHHHAITTYALGVWQMVGNGPTAEQMELLTTHRLHVPPNYL